MNTARATAFAALAVAALCACAPDEAQELKTLETPPLAVRAAVFAARPDMTIRGFEYKERDGRRYYDVAGQSPDGAEIELDLLETESGWSVVEIQRDIPWADAPAPVRAAAADAFTPARVIESVQTEDGSTIYELFAEGRPEAPSLEVRWLDGKAAILAEPNPH